MVDTKLGREARLYGPGRLCFQCDGKLLDGFKARKQQVRDSVFFFFKFFFSFIFISWRLITLQYCSGFCHTLT